MRNQNTVKEAGGPAGMEQKPKAWWSHPGVTLLVGILIATLGRYTVEALGLEGRAELSASVEYKKCVGTPEAGEAVAAARAAFKERGQRFRDALVGVEEWVRATKEEGRETPDWLNTLRELRADADGRLDFASIEVALMKATKWQFVEVQLENAGAITAEDVQVEVDDVVWAVVERRGRSIDPVLVEQVIEVGALQPSERVTVHAWAESQRRDAVVVRHARGVGAVDEKQLVSEGWAAFANQVVPGAVKGVVFTGSILLIVFLGTVAFRRPEQNNRRGSDVK